MPVRTKTSARPARRSRPDLGRTQRRLLEWFDEHGRSFPWRETRDPYRTMVAEVMLQQTQTGRVAPAYQDFLGRFPTLDRLAHAPAMEVIQAWRGLGYNRRAVELQRAAQKIVGEHGGVFPANPTTLRRMPGLGEYSANAIACFAFDEQVPVVDTNVRRVLARAALGTEAGDVAASRLTTLAIEWLPGGEAYRWNQALMDVGAMLCRTSKPLCPACPLRAACLFHAKGRHRTASARAARTSDPFEGSRRQTRGTIVDHLRRAARQGITLGELVRQMHPDGGGDTAALAEILNKLESEGLAELSPSARTGSARGLVRLPSKGKRR